MGGRKIDDHSVWVGKAKAGEVFPDGNKVKTMSLQDGAGELSKYEDTAEAIKAQQEKAVKKIRAHAQPSDQRN